MITRFFVTTLFLSLFVSHSAATSVTGLKVVGNQIQNSAGQVVVLRGVNRPGTQYQCVKNPPSFFDGDVSASAITSMQNWKMNAVRVPLNEDCWTGNHGANPSFSGSIYQSTITSYVNSLTSSGMAVILDLHWNSNTTYLAVSQLPMPSVAYSIDFWTQVATAFMGNSAVIFDIFNEPVPNGGTSWDSDTDWSCWLTGSTGCYSEPYDYAGMQNLTDAVRATGATNIIMVGGIEYASSLSQWMKYKPYDPLNNMIAAVHSYDFNSCKSRGCWDTWLEPIYSQVPLIAGETGEDDCSTLYMYDWMNYADDRGISYLAWAWLTGDCAEEPSLISAYDGTPTAYGIALQTNLFNLARNKQLSWSWTYPVLHENSGEPHQYNVSHWFDDWSSALWQNRDYNNTDIQAKEGSYTLKYTGTNGAESLQWMCWGCINTSQHISITFWVNGNGFSDQVYQIRLQKVNSYYQILDSTASLSDVTNAATTSINLLLNGGINSKGWTQATIDLSSFPAGQYDGFRIWSDTPQNPIYLDAIYVNAPHSAGGKVFATWTVLIGMLTTSLFLLL